MSPARQAVERSQHAALQQEVSKPGFSKSSRCRCRCDGLRKSGFEAFSNSRQICAEMLWIRREAFFARPVGLVTRSVTATFSVTATLLDTGSAAVRRGRP